VVPITWTAGIDFSATRAEDLLLRGGAPGKRTVMYVMDMFSSGFAAPWPLRSAVRCRDLAGQLVVVQSITAAKCELVQELVGQECDLRWRSLSDWDSSALLPPHICQLGDELRPGCRPEGPEGQRLRERHPLVSGAGPVARRLLDELTDLPGVPAAAPHAAGASDPEVRRQTPERHVGPHVGRPKATPSRAEMRRGV